jgi:hypothetical protein
MEPPIALRKLASNYNLQLECSDKKFFRKYNIKVTSTLRKKIEIGSASCTLTAPVITNLRKLAKVNYDSVRKERWSINYYTNSIDTAADVINIIKNAGGDVWNIHWFPDNIGKNILIRKKPTKFKWGIKLKAGVDKDRIRVFADKNRDQLLLDKNTNLELYPETNIRDSYRRSFYSNQRPGTYNHTYYRFKDETLKNYFLFSFAESVVQETTYKLITEVENEQ